MTSPEPSAPTLWTRIHRVPLVLQIAAGMLLGIVLALVWPAAARSVALLGDVFVMALKSVAPVLVLVLVAASIASHKRGHVSHAFFKEAVLGRYYAICNCCSCCCGAMQAHREGVPMLASSGYLAALEADNCLHCGL